MCFFKKKEKENKTLKNDILPQGELKPIGGVIFYEDMFAGGSYRLYDKDKNVTSDKSKAVYYEIVIPGSGPRFYAVDLKLEGPYRWTRQNQKIGVEGTDIGMGKFNTLTVLETEDHSPYPDPSLWKALTERNKNFVGGCNDWFVGSRDEVDEVLKSGVGKDWFKPEKGHKKRDKLLLWSSSEREHPDLVWYWDEEINKWYRQIKQWGCKVCFIRSF